MSATDQHTERRISALERQCELLSQAAEALVQAVDCKSAERKRKLEAHAQAMLEEARP